MSKANSTEPMNEEQRAAAAQIRSPEFDQPEVDPHRPANWYLLCATQRSGSHFLGRLLLRAGIGAPLEYFNIRTNVELRARWNSKDGDHDHYLSELLRWRTSPNGAWGCSLHWTHYLHHQQVLDQRLLPHAKLIYLCRRDLVSQAISLHLARRTGYWGFDGVQTTDPRVDSRGRPRKLGSVLHTVKCAGKLKHEFREWEKFFAQRKLNVFRIFHEDIAADQPGAIRRIAEYLGLPEGSYRLPKPEPRDNKMPEEVEAARKHLGQRRPLIRFLINVSYPGRAGHV